MRRLQHPNVLYVYIPKNKIPVFEKFVGGTDTKPEYCFN